MCFCSLDSISPWFSTFHPMFMTTSFCGVNCRTWRMFFAPIHWSYITASLKQWHNSPGSNGCQGPMREDELLTVGSVIGRLCQLRRAPSGSDQKMLLALKRGHVRQHLFEGAYHDFL